MYNIIIKTILKKKRKEKKNKKKGGILVVETKSWLLKKGPQMWLTPGQACRIANDYDLIDCVYFAIKGKFFSFRMNLYLNVK